MLSAALIMAISAVGPAFLNNTAVFTQNLLYSFAFVILFATVLEYVVQLNIWRVLCVSGLRGSEVANKVLPGAGYLVTALIVFGGLAFNIGNVGGGGLGFATILGGDALTSAFFTIGTFKFGWLEFGYLVSAVIAITVFVMKDALRAMDMVTRVMGGAMILVILIVVGMVNPPLAQTAKEAILPTATWSSMYTPIMALLGGTIGGYITFAGAHRLIDAGITGQKNLREISVSSIMGVSVATVVRIFLFLLFLGVIVTGVAGNADFVLNPDSPAADAFNIASGRAGGLFFGIVLMCAAITSIIGAAYTSISFLKTSSQWIANNEKLATVLFIVFSTIVILIFGRPAKIMVFAGVFNGLILPITLTICLIAANSKKIMGEGYRHATWLTVTGAIVAPVVAYMAIEALIDLLKSNLF